MLLTSEVIYEVKFEVNLYFIQQSEADLIF